MIATLRRRLAVPVLGRELRVRMRHRRITALLTACLAVAIGAGIAAYGLSPQGAGDPRVVARAGTAMFRAAAAVTLVLVALLSAALGAGTLSGEAERGTLDGIRAMPLPTWRLVAGKVLGAFLLGILLVAAPLPIFGVAVYLGGAEPATVAAVLGAGAASALLGAAFGVLCSAAGPSTTSATAAALGVVMLLGGLPLVLHVITPQAGASGGVSCTALLCPAPAPSGIALAAASPSPLTAAVPLLIANPGDATSGSDWWHVVAGVDAGATVMLVGVTAMVVRMRRWPA
jgi:hypothetical protein